MNLILFVASAFIDMKVLILCLFQKWTSDAEKRSRNALAKASSCKVSSSSAHSRNAYASEVGGVARHSHRSGHSVSRSIHNGHVSLASHLIRVLWVPESRSLTSNKATVIRLCQIGALRSFCAMTLASVLIFFSFITSKYIFCVHDWKRSLYASV